MKQMDKDFTETIESSEELTSSQSDGNGPTFKRAMPFSGERVSQHLLVSALLALQVLVTRSLPGAMLTQVSMHSSGKHGLPDLRELPGAGVIGCS